MSELMKQKLSDLEQVGVSPQICENLANYVENAPALRLHQISPFRIADTWEMDRNEVLNAFLYGTKAGIFDLEWDIKCPSCTGPTSSKKTLADLISKSHCDYCQIDINGSFDDAVEVTFSVNPGIRDTGNLNPIEIMRSWMQMEDPMTFSADPNDQQEVKMSLTPGSYHMFSRELGVSCPLLVTEEEVETERLLEYTYDGQKLTRDTERYGTGLFSIRLMNKTLSEVEFMFTRLKAFPWVSGAMVASNQIFRDYFSSELISADETFSVKNVVFVFTDIKSSTNLYERRGDSKAYYLVKEHFKIMTEKVNAYNGAIVKTIGDAIMATFLSSGDAMNAVFEMHKAFDEFNAKEELQDDIIIKVGVHRGPCIAVTSNDKLDYFGRTVNIAARVQGLSGGRDVMVSNDMYKELGMQELINKRGWKTRNIQATLKGIQGPYDVVHLTR